MSLHDKLKNLVAGAAVAATLLFGAPETGNAAEIATLTRKAHQPYYPDYLARELLFLKQKIYAPSRWGTRSDINWDLMWLNPRYLRDAHFRLIPEINDRLDLVGEAQSIKSDIVPCIGMQYYHQFDGFRSLLFDFD